MESEGNVDIYMCNLSTLKETQIVANSTCPSPSIYGDRIIWAEDHNGDYGIYMYSISGENLTSGAGKKTENMGKNSEDKILSGFETVSTIICLLSVFLWCRR